jgi:hypothetical protein
MRRDDRSYFVRRAAEEGAAATRATCSQVAEAHREMAARYALMAGNLSEQTAVLSA